MQTVIEVDVKTGDITQRQMTQTEIDSIPVQTASDIIASKKSFRANLVSKIEVTTQSGNSFDGNEDAQNRMARALAGMNDADVIPWVLSNNSIVNVGKAELKEALRLAGQSQSFLWVHPYL